jgi:hypothetical protein
MLPTRSQEKHTKAQGKALERCTPGVVRLTGIWCHERPGSYSNGIVRLEAYYRIDRQSSDE